MIKKVRVDKIIKVSQLNAIQSFLVFYAFTILKVGFFYGYSIEHRLRPEKPYNEGCFWFY